jgi:quinol monooxygenase YgiN
MVKLALVVRLVARPGKEAAVRELLAGEQELIRAEPFTPAWFALGVGHGVFYIVDAFRNEGDREKHLAGSVARLLMSELSELLAEPAKIEKADAIGVKLPG